MAPEYRRDETGTVHVMAPDRGGEFTFCDVSNDEVQFGLEELDLCAGPATCADCRYEVDAVREAVRGVRWARRLRARPDPEDREPIAEGDARYYAPPSLEDVVGEHYRDVVYVEPWMPVLDAPDLPDDAAPEHCLH